MNEKQWAHKRLLDMWIILQMPDYEDGEPVLKEDDIHKLMQYVTEVNTAMREATQ